MDLVQRNKLIKLIFQVLVTSNAFVVSSSTSSAFSTAARWAPFFCFSNTVLPLFYLLSLKVINLHFQFIWNVACDLKEVSQNKGQRLTRGASQTGRITAATQFLHSGGQTLGGPDLLCVCLGVSQAMVEQECVGAIVCKLDMHKKMFRRGYIAMLAVDSKHRRKSIGESPNCARQTRRPSLLRGSVATESMVFFDKAISVQTEVPDKRYPFELWRDTSYVSISLF